MLKIGLTGGIASGKTTVTQLFSELNVPIIDADDIAHAIVLPGQPALNSIKQTFGCNFITQEGLLNRKKMRDYIFSNSLAKQKLEAILHPLIYAAILTKIKQLHVPYCIICIPLLFESNMEHLADRILVVDCPVELQIKRLKKRQHMTAEQAQSIIDSQLPRNEKRSRANDIIDNTTNQDSLVQQINALHQLYISLSPL